MLELVEDGYIMVRGKCAACHGIGFGEMRSYCDSCGARLGHELTNEQLHSAGDVLPCCGASWKKWREEDWCEACSGDDATGPGVVTLTVSLSELKEFFTVNKGVVLA